MFAYFVDFAEVAIFPERLVEKTVLLVSEVNAAKALPEIPRIGAEFTITAGVAVNQQIAVVTKRRLHAAVAEFRLKTNSEVAGARIAVTLYIVEARFQVKCIIAVAAVD